MIKFPESNELNALSKERDILFGVSKTPPAGAAEMKEYSMNVESEGPENEEGERTEMFRNMTLTQAFEDRVIYEDIVESARKQLKGNFLSLIYYELLKI